MNSKSLIFISALSLVSSAVGAKAKKSLSERPNILMVLIDDLGKEWIEQYGAQDMKLPNIQRLADKSIIFNRAYSMPQSTPSRAVLLTGQYPYNSGWVNHYDVPRWGYGAHFDVNRNPSFPRLLRDNGYKTCAAGKWQLNDFRLQPNAMDDVGFSSSFMWTGGEGGNATVSGNRYWDPYIHTNGKSKVYKGAFGPDLYSDYIVDFIEQNREEPMFIYYPMALTHTPFVHTPLKMDVKTARDKHIAMTEYTDFIIGKLMKALEDNGVMDNTYIIIATDNGTSRSCVGRIGDTYIRGGKSLLSENGINCPFFVHVAGQKEARVSNALIDFTDVSATILDLASTKPDKKYKQDGVSFVPVLKGAKKSSKGYAMSMGGNPATIGDDLRILNSADFRDRVIIGEKYKVYVGMDRSIVRIFDIVADRFEQNDLVGNSEVVAQAEKIFRPIIDAMPKVDARPKYDILKHDKALNFKFKALKRNVQKLNCIPLAKKAEFDKFNKTSASVK